MFRSVTRIVAGALLAATITASVGAQATPPPKRSRAERMGSIVSGLYPYKIGEQDFDGFMARPEKIEGKVPGVLVVHDWMGNGEFAYARASSLAQQGYVAFAIDVYGRGKRAKNAAEAAELAKPFYEDRALFRERLKASLAELLKREEVDPKRVAIIGFCFGGSAALELARSGADIKGVVSFHGGLGTPKPEETKDVKAKLLILHGSRDPLVPPAEVAAFMTEMNKANVEYRFVAYPNAVHAFTNPGAGTDQTKPAAYNLDVAVAAYREMWAFLNSLLQ
ncbi:MAG: dienelactone hydrolase family protein [Verrucomicrobia bacterium]|nr:dienelactone hydrolase family protein [Verrucomicrobiota bacterium]